MKIGTCLSVSTMFVITGAAGEVVILVAGLYGIYGVESDSFLNKENHRNENSQKESYNIIINMNY